MDGKVLAKGAYDVLMEIALHPTSAYGAGLHARLEKTSGKHVSMGAIYTVLDRLERYGYVSSQWGQPTAERGGRRKRVYSLTANGERALRATAAAYARVPEGFLVPGVA